MKTEYYQVSLKNIIVIIWYERYQYIQHAIDREKEIKEI
jgi:predicted GIY-YIG superfamily endonuclease